MVRLCAPFWLQFDKISSVEPYLDTLGDSPMLDLRRVTDILQLSQLSLASGITENF